MALELSLRIQYMYEDGVVPGRSSPWSPIELQLKRRTRGEDMVFEIVPQKVDLIGEGRRQEIVGIGGLGSRPSEDGAGGRPWTLIGPSLRKLPASFPWASKIGRLGVSGRPRS